MAKLNIDRGQLDHPEHFDDEIREFRDSGRYVPTNLEYLLFELAGHKCTICGAPWLELHHIVEISEGGETAFDNLIVLCPNCHTRVHRENVPSGRELRHYKMKQEIAYELPIYSKLSVKEKDIIRCVAFLTPEEQIVFTKRYWKEVEAVSQEDAVRDYRLEVGLFHLQESGMLVVEQDFCCTILDGERHSITLLVKLTGKGVKWVRYLCATGRISSI